MIYLKTEKMVKSFDSTSLYVSKLIPATVKATIVIVHGLAEHLGRYDELANTFAENNFAVYRFDLRGHGKSEGQRAYFSNFTVIIEDVKFIVEMARNEHPQVPLFVLGHSLGGFASACFGSKYPNKADGIILSGALTNDNKGLIRSVPQGLAATDYLPNELGHLICTDLSVVAAYQNDPLVLTCIPGLM
jgi:lysophospholipase